MTVPWYQWQGDDLILHIRVQPRASRDEVDGLFITRHRFSAS